MTEAQSKKRLIVTIIVLGVLLIGVAGAVVVKRLNTSSEPAKTATPVQSTDVSDTDSSTEADIDESTPPEASSVPAVDPLTLNSVDIEPLSIKVFYTKGVAGFDFVVKRTADKTEYVEFSNAELIGTKCTDDVGTFASIIKNPTASTQPATTQTIKVGEDTYGLSLAGKGCTSNVELLDQYQTAFTNGFASLSAF